MISNIESKDILDEIQIITEKEVAL